MLFKEPITGRDTGVFDTKLSLSHFVLKLAVKYTSVVTFFLSRFNGANNINVRLAYVPFYVNNQFCMHFNF